MKFSSIIKLFFIVVTLVELSVGCKKLPDGFLSPYIRYEESPIVIQRGSNFYQMFHNYSFKMI